MCGPGKLWICLSPRLSPRLPFPHLPRFPQLPGASVESVKTLGGRILAKPGSNIAKFPKAKRRHTKGWRSFFALSTCHSEGCQRCQRCETESGRQSPHRQVENACDSLTRESRKTRHASKLERWRTLRASRAHAQYCHGFFNGAGKVHISQSDCKAEITARLEFKAALLVFEDLYGGLLRRTQGGQGTPALKWTWSGQLRRRHDRHDRHGEISGRASKDGERLEVTTRSEQKDQKGRWKNFEVKSVKNKKVRHKSHKRDRWRGCTGCSEQTQRSLWQTKTMQQAFDVGQFFETRRIWRASFLSWEFLAGLFDAVAHIRLIQGEIILEITHQSCSLLESVRHFLLDTLQEEVALEAMIDAIILHDFHRCNRLVVCSNLSRVVLQKLLKSLKVRRRAVELILSTQIPNLADLRLMASAQGAYLEWNSQGKLRLIPKSQSFKRRLEFQARQEDAKEIRYLLELETLASFTSFTSLR
eukprot:s83_g9.t1